MGVGKIYGDTFDFAGRTVEYEFEALPGEAEELIEDFVRRDQYAQARVGALGAAIRTLRVDGKLIFKNTQKGARRIKGNQGANLPSPREYFDREEQESLTKRLTKIMVKYEFWLADLFPECFEEFVDEEEPVENPTDDPDGPRTGQGS